MGNKNINNDDDGGGDDDDGDDNNTTEYKLNMSRRDYDLWCRHGAKQRPPLIDY